jgi:hypothetical protein
MVKLFYIFIFLLSFGTSYASNSENDIQREFSSYPWYQSLKEYQGPEGEFVNYRMKADIILYLERNNLYKTHAGSLSILDCIDQEYAKSKEYKHFVKNENQRFLNTLQEPRVQNILFRASVYEIINGKNGFILAQKKTEYKKFCNGILNDSCAILSENIENMQSLPQSHVSS